MPYKDMRPKREYHGEEIVAQKSKSKKEEKQELKDACNGDQSCQSKGLH